MATPKSRSAGRPLAATRARSRAGILGSIELNLGGGVSKSLKFMAVSACSNLILSVMESKRSFLLLSVE